MDQSRRIEIIGAEIQEEVARRVKAAGLYAVMMDETADVSHKEQVAIFVRFVNDTNATDCRLGERLLALVDTAATTGEALAKLLLDTMERHDLNVQHVVGQGHTMEEVAYAVQLSASRPEEKN